MNSKDYFYKETIRQDFDRIAQFSEPKWEHNSHYHKYLLQNIPLCNSALDIGCGTGSFARLLSARANEVTAIDLSPAMIRHAISLSQGYKNIHYLVGDIFEYQSSGRYDCIVSIAAMHHLLPDVLPIIKDLLAPKGVFIVLDLYKPSSLADYLFSLIAVPASIFMRLIKNGRLKRTHGETAAWDNHAPHDDHKTLKELQDLLASVLPGSSIRRHLFWRYSMIWVKNQ